MPSITYESTAASSQKPYSRPSKPRPSWRTKWAPTFCRYANAWSITSLRAEPSRKASRFVSWTFMILKKSAIIASQSAGAPGSVVSVVRNQKCGLKWVRRTTPPFERPSAMPVFSGAPTTQSSWWPVVSVEAASTPCQALPTSTIRTHASRPATRTAYGYCAGASADCCEYQVRRPLTPARACTVIAAGPFALPAPPVT